MAKKATKKLIKSIDTVEVALKLPFSMMVYVAEIASLSGVTVEQAFNVIMAISIKRFEGFSDENTG